MQNLVCAGAVNNWMLIVKARAPQHRPLQKVRILTVSPEVLLELPQNLQ